MQAPLQLKGEHVHLASADEVRRAILAANEVFAQHNVNPLACAAAYDKLEKDEPLSKDEALLCVIWDAADDKAFRAATVGWLQRDLDIWLTANRDAS